MTPGFAFTVTARAGEGDQGPRLGQLTTPHGDVDTPAFMPVGTRGSVKGVSPEQLRAIGAQLILANTYHLTIRPGEDTVRALGGLSRFTGWHGPVLTDSGGFQVLSLADLRTIDDDRVVFRSHVDGARIELTPERVLDIQATLGSDVAMVLDDCPPSEVSREGAAEALRRTLLWARRSIEHRERLTAPDPMAVFGILQGGAFEDLRKEGAQALGALPFDGFAIGGVSVGESRETLLATIPWGTRHLPGDRPRYLMGVGGLEEFFHAIDHGVDLFDCVLPTRNARNGHLLCRWGPPVRIKNARHARDPGPIEEGCDCPTCLGFSRGFLHHLILRKELLGYTLASLHNLRVFLRFLEEARRAIADGAWAELAATVPRSS